MSEHQAMRAWHHRLQEDIGVAHANVVLDRVDGAVTEDYLDTALDRALEAQASRLMAAWRKDLLLVSVAQFFALAAAVGAIAALA